jgi:hypothetical protein
METSSQLERDLRSANHAWKRGKDASVKWSMGKRPLYGAPRELQIDHMHGLQLPESEKARPMYKMSDRRGDQMAKAIREHNVNKPSRLNHNMPNGRVRGKGRGQEEIGDISRSVAELAPSFTTSASDVDNMYALDAGNDTPARPLALDMFVKTGARDGTERLVEKEYEVVDTNGDTLKGRKARRRNLRKSGSDAGSQEDDVNDVDGFELV